MEQLFTTLDDGRHRARQTSTSPGTSRSRASATSPSGCCTSATTPSRQLGDTNLGDLKVQGTRRRPFTGRRHAVRHDGCQTATTRSPASVDGHRSPCRATSTRRAARPASRFIYAPGADDAAADPGQHDARQLHLQHPALGVDGRRTPGARRRSTATACSAARARSTAGNVKAMAERAQLRLLRHRLDRHVDRGRRRTSPTILAGPLELPDARRPRCSRACSTSCSSGRLMIHPHGLRDRRRRSRSRTATPRDRHRAPVLRRQQPGRHHRRRADRGRARLRRAPCSACRA